MIRAPFNFVPLSENVFFPDWADQISQDIPFSDGISGRLELKITAESPIFVRNGHTREDADNKNDTYTSFSKTSDGRYFIPATSIKGAIRDVLEIMSFGKMNQIANNRYAIRDLQLKEGYLSFFQNASIHCGWLSKKGDSITITDNGIPRRISHMDLDNTFGTDFCDKFSDKEFMKADSNRSPIIKYEIVKGKNLTHHFRELPLNPKNIVDKRIKVVFDKDGQEGTIVFTGQSGFRKEATRDSDGTVLAKASGKFYEFVFMNAVEATYTLDAEKEDGIYKDFCFVYKDSNEWKFWREKMEKYNLKVPVFFYVKDGSLIHLGLSYLYKLPFPKRIKEYLNADHNSHNLDLCDCIFGCIEDKSLRGRVQFSNAFCTSGEISHTLLRPYMGGPKPTYYPIYLVQNGKDGSMSDSDGHNITFKTMLDRDAKLKGWKRYPIHQSCTDYFIVPEGQDDNTNPFYPMEANSTFKCIVNFHNLKEVELGALINSLELHKGYFHSIGFAKAFGYGKVKIEIENINGTEKDKEDLKNLFIDLMKNNIDNYTKSPQLRELMLMMMPQTLKAPLEYMDLEEFVKCKRQTKGSKARGKEPESGEYLRYYSELIKKKPEVQKPAEMATAKVTFFKGNLKMAKLIEGKDQNPKTLIVSNFKIKLKMDDLIEVEKDMKDGNVRQLIFKKVL
jgi:CRISPR-associated protein (TIGR03986 family)